MNNKETLQKTKRINEVITMSSNSIVENISNASNFIPGLLESFRLLIDSLKIKEESDKKTIEFIEKMYDQFHTITKKENPSKKEQKIMANLIIKMAKQLKNINKNNNKFKGKAYTEVLKNLSLLIMVGITAIILSTQNKAKK